MARTKATTPKSATKKTTLKKPALKLTPKQTKQTKQATPKAKQIKDPVIKRALISVTDKTGIVDFARTLVEEFKVEIVSTGGTARAIEEAGIAVRPIDDLTGFPEMMDGRVKTLHPRVHGGLLARRDVPAHMRAAAKHDIGMIDMVVVNLYAFEATVAKKGVTFAEAIENIDIGGPSMLRSAAKNHASVAVVTNPTSYDAVLNEMRSNKGALTAPTRQRLALEVFQLTSAYDNAINGWLAGALAKQKNLGTNDIAPVPTGTLPEQKRVFLNKEADLRYGENPHQKAAFYRMPAAAQGTAQGKSNPAYELANAPQLQGKELSYNNYLDLDAAWGAVREFDKKQPTCVIVKHLTPCGVSSAANITKAYQAAHDCDAVSAFGGVMAFNVEVPAALIKAIYKNGQFIEALVAPSFEKAALKLLAEKPNVRVLATGGMNPAGATLDLRSIEGGMLAMVADSVAEKPEKFTVPTKRKPTAKERAELLFAWRVCKSVKSNAIVITKGGTTVGIGAGQPNRVNSAQLAAKQAGKQAQGAVAASDAFMPFADSLKVLIKAGVKAVIQPGGSMRDDEVIAAADAAGVALLFTGHRHFRH
ncbi:MAG: bifunctional phosphoribosylaminoimidazolecarboxamide formyltransferase/IMP cyclohydrolase [Coriobacteriales bacterium]|jgi:phosphoribosylaminoimidazolecarboxamide formyltransferase/IMP cyclohydrolase|nr:bifunctional phosphoribosylaminoimidazolecarboxamide formyltransferase/IMP cyclohydrolase [Coriobacteriales bacterium]